MESICYNLETQDYYTAELISECNEQYVFFETFQDYCEESLNVDFSEFMNNSSDESNDTEE